MRNVPNAWFDNLDAVKSDGTPLPASRKAGQALGVTLPGAGTWYFPVGSAESSFVGDAPLLAVHLRWDNAVAAVFTIEVSNFPRYVGGGDKGIDDTLDYDQTAGLWLPVNPANSYGAFAGGAGSAYANSSLTAAGATAGGGVIVMPNVAARRARVKAVVTAGGVARCGAWGKLLML